MSRGSHFQRGRAEQRDLYADLGVAEGATDAEIKRAHHKLVLKAHPDKQGDPAEFRKVQEAYEVLIDPEQRQKYDMSREEEDPGYDDSDSYYSDGEEFQQYPAAQSYSSFEEYLRRAQEDARAKREFKEREERERAERQEAEQKRRADAEEKQRARDKTLTIEREEEARDSVIAREDRLHEKLMNSSKKMKQTVSRKNCSCQGCRDRFIRESDEMEKKKRDPKGHAERVALREKIALRKQEEAAREARKEAKRLAQEQRAAEKAAFEEAKAQEKAANEQAARERIHQQIAEQKAKEQAVAEEVAKRRKLEQRAKREAKKAAAREAKEAKAKESVELRAREAAEREAAEKAHRLAEQEALEATRRSATEQAGDRRAKIHCKHGKNCKYLANGTCVYGHHEDPPANNPLTGSPADQAQSQPPWESTKAGSTPASSSKPKTVEQKTGESGDPAPSQATEQENAPPGLLKNLSSAAKLKLSNSYIQTTKEAVVLKLLQEGTHVPAEGIAVDLGWTNAGYAPACFFCKFKKLKYSFRCPQGDAVACGRCKKRLSLVTPVDEAFMTME
ncbi:uncharacterized protein N0V89_008960 [Didymosphaeria variabile]|uniref:J domain-containing protein n=1 Tax=Didymosphaeria variabile TaxID=1932322 RepID=A0A9W8XIP0_9PLEO|nr:uncharacterized protein N0V89_008960 [Didymosphaeria variabile]KAJ4350339.1 hypothetical protein N0V89_008960 [Didymosphaeria variabile]